MNPENAPKNVKTVRKLRSDDRYKLLDWVRVTGKELADKGMGRDQLAKEASTFVNRDLGWLAIKEIFQYCQIDVKAAKKSVRISNRIGIIIRQVNAMAKAYEVALNPEFSQLVTEMERQRDK